MIPYFEIPPLKLIGLEFHAFGFMVALGFFLATQVAMNRAKHLKLSPIAVSDISLIAIVAGIMGAHVFDVLFYNPQLLREDPLVLIKFWKGLSSYGGMIATVCCVGLYLYLKKLPILPYLDILMYAGVLGFAIGRTGCFFAHDHPGQLSDFFTAVQFPGGARHDLGMYEMVFLYLGFLMLYLLTGKARKKPSFWGRDACLVFLYYAPVRFFLEFFRATDVAHSDKRYLGLTPAHYVSIGAFSLSLCAILYLYNKHQKTK